MAEDVHPLQNGVSRRRVLSLGGRLGVGAVGAFLVAGDAARRPTPSADGSAQVPAVPDAGEPAGHGGVVVDVRDFGAAGDGTTDDTVAVQAAAATGRALFFPAGRYRGSFDLDLVSPRIVGTDKHDVEILLEDGHFLVDSDQQWRGLRVENVTVRGGAGVIRNRYSGDNVTDQSIVLDCQFYGYSGAAISTESSDMPMWRVERCLFYGGNQDTSVGIAWNGLTDTNVIQRCEFQRNRTHVKLGHGGNNVYIANNDFLQYDPPVEGLHRSMIWIVPEVGRDNAGAGLTIADNKFGNENLGPADFRVLYADEGPGQYFGDRLADHDSDSSGYIVGHVVRGGLVNGSEGVDVPIVHSTTQRVRGCQIGGIVLGGTMPSYVFEVRSPGMPPDPESSGNLAGPFTTPDRYRAPLRLCNQPGMFTLVDPAQAFDGGGTTVLPYAGGGRSTGYVNLLSGRVGTFRTEAGATRDLVADAVGGPEAVEVAFNATGRIRTELLVSSFQADFPIWLEFDLQQGSEDPLSEMIVSFGLDGADDGGAGEFLRRRVAPRTGWRPYRFLAATPEVTGRPFLSFAPMGGAQGSRAQIGRVRMYHAREPIAADLTLPDASTTPNAPSSGQAAPLPTAPAGYLSVSINGVPRRIAYY